MSLDRMFEVLEGLRETTSADVAFGQPQEVEGRVLIPVASVATGFGVGFGRGVAEEEDEESEMSRGKEEADALEAEKAAEGGGAGGGAGARPVAVIEVTPEKTVIRPIVDESKVALAGIMLGGWVVFWLLATIRAVFGRKRRGV